MTTKLSHDIWEAIDLLKEELKSYGLSFSDFGPTNHEELVIYALNFFRANAYTDACDLGLFDEIDLLETTLKAAEVQDE